MSLYEQYAGQVHLILNVLPEIAREEVFVLKGGTAINLFYRDMPRLSVDIDLTYLPTSDRATALRDIETTLGRIIAAIADRHPHIRVRPMAGDGGNDTQIVMRSGHWKLMNLEKLKRSNPEKHAAQRDALEELL